MKRITKVAPKNLPIGLYHFQVIEVAAETDPKKGHDYLKIKMGATNMDTGEKRLAFDRLPITEEMSWKLGDFLVAVGYPVKEDGSVDWDDSELVGKSGYLSAIENTAGDKKFINYRYLPPDDQQLKELIEDAEPVSPAPASTNGSAPTPTPVPVAVVEPEMQFTLSSLDARLAARKKAAQETATHYGL
jgi:hypothetical protein